MSSEEDSGSSPDFYHSDVGILSRSARSIDSPLSQRTAATVCLRISSPDVGDAWPIRNDQGKPGSRPSTAGAHSRPNARLRPVFATDSHNNLIDCPATSRTIMRDIEFHIDATTSRQYDLIALSCDSKILDHISASVTAAINLHKPVLNLLMRPRGLIHRAYRTTGHNCAHANQRKRLDHYFHVGFFFAQRIVEPHRCQTLIQQIPSIASLSESVGDKGGNTSCGPSS